MPESKEVVALVKVFEDMYKYYKGWVFGFEYPGFFAYHQMGGDLSVYFTPDWDRRGAVSIQVNDHEGNVLETEAVPYVHPGRNGKAYEVIEAGLLFRIVKNWLDKYGA